MTLDQLEALCRGATPGEWHRVGAPWLPNDCETYVVAGNGDPHVSEMVCDFLDAGTAGVEDKYDAAEWSARNDANAAYIAACSPDYILKLIRVARAARMYASSPDELETALEALTPETGNE